MKLAEIKQAVLNGEKVHWSSNAYDVIYTFDNDFNIISWLIRCNVNDHCIGLTHLDGVTLNGNEDQFFTQTKKGK